ncbi:hypothetical protein MKX78_08950 [Cytobacillus sp. FSL R5-0569]|uniref:hypothetical protein n=1 Tax=Cytobacillus sp. FSL R5-0569 TaxID=2921649 RepID=UPI0030F57078
MSETKYEPVRAKGFLGGKEPKDLYINTNREVKTTTVSPLDRIEQKMDRILELLEGQELPTPVKVNGKAIAEIIKSDFEKNKLNRRHL